MPPKRGGGNSKVEKALAKREEVEAAKASKKAQDDERKASQEWSVGANARASKRAEEEEAKQADKARKAAEKKRLQDLEEAEAAGAKRVVKTGRKAEVPPWEAALMDTGGKKSSFQKKQEAKKRQEEKLKQLGEEDEEKESKPIPGTVQAMPLIENVNRRNTEAEVATDVESALELLGEGGSDRSRNQKALYKAFEEVQLPIMRQEFPGLKLSQYRDRIFEMWKRSPENPRNQEAAAPNPSSRR